MPTIKIDINTGIEYSATDGIDSAVKLHNFTVGVDGSLYKLPALKNLKNTSISAWSTGVETVYWPFRLMDIRKFQTTALEEDFTPPLPIPYVFKDQNMFRRFVYLTMGSYGVINVDYDGKRIYNTDIPFSHSKYGEFEHDVYQYVPDISEFPKVDLSSLSQKIIVDFNTQFSDETHETISGPIRCVFPTQHMFMSKAASNYPLMLTPQNIIHCTMDALATSPDIQPIDIFDVSGSEREKNDLARGCILAGNRMFFYSALDNAIYVSSANAFTHMMEDPENKNKAYKIIPSEEIQAITDFNSNIITFTPSGMDRWVLSDDDETILVRDPTFHYDHRIRYGGSYVKANRDLYYYTDDFQVYRLNSNLTVDSVFDGTLPVYKPLEDYLSKDKDLPMAYFKMLGYRFVSMGPWLFNIDSGTWSTYSYDGWKNPQNSPTPEEDYYIWSNDTTKRVISTAYDDLIGTYSTICKPLTYKEMQDEVEFDDENPSLVEEKHQWGDVAFFTTRMFQDEKTFSLDGVEAYVRGGILPVGAQMWLKVLRGGELGDFDEKDQSTWGVAATYEPCSGVEIGEDASAHVGKFIWRTNLKTDRFRLQFITTEKRGMVVQAVLANITDISTSQKFLIDSQSGRREGQ